MWKKFDHSNYLLNQSNEKLHEFEKLTLNKKKKCLEYFGATFFTSVSGPKFRKKIVMSTVLNE